MLFTDDDNDSGVQQPSKHSRSYECYALGVNTHWIDSTSTSTTDEDEDDSGIDSPICPLLPRGKRHMLAMADAAALQSLLSSPAPSLSSPSGSPDPPSDDSSSSSNSICELPFRLPLAARKRNAHGVFGQGSTAAAAAAAPLLQTRSRLLAVDTTPKPIARPAIAVADSSSNGPWAPLLTNDLRTARLPPAAHALLARYLHADAVETRFAHTITRYCSRALARSVLGEHLHAFPVALVVEYSAPEALLQAVDAEQWFASAAAAAAGTRDKDIRHELALVDCTAGAHQVDRYVRLGARVERVFHVDASRFTHYLSDEGHGFSGDRTREPRFSVSPALRAPRHWMCDYENLVEYAEKMKRERKDELMDDAYRWVCQYYGVALRAPRFRRAGRQKERKEALAAAAAKSNANTKANAAHYKKTATQTLLRRFMTSNSSSSSGSLPPPPPAHRLGLLTATRDKAIVINSAF